jgi:hypothetical protein
MTEDFETEDFSIEQTLSGWVMGKVEAWKEHYDSEYRQKHEEYYRIWRGHWAAQDKTRESERSRLISPATQQAVESSVAEIEEATFGRGRWFDIKDDLQDEESGDVSYLKKKLYEDFQKQKIRKATAECLLTSAVYGSGIAEVCIETVKEMAPATQPIMDGQLQAVGVNITDRTVVRLRPILPQNFAIDPAAVDIADALGCAIDEDVPTHEIEEKQEQGVYKKVRLDTSVWEDDREPDITIQRPAEGRTRRTTYFGKVPRELLEAARQEEGVEVVTLTEDSEEKSKYVEAIVVIANGGALLKAEENPYMMQDRPVIAFPWDIVPGRFWGRGICEKAYNSQKALDAELRARQDALALTVHPMIGVDSTRMPRGMSMDVRPGKTILTVGPPGDVIQPIRLGAVDQVTFVQAEALQRMLQMATGAIDSAGIAGSINGDATAAGISMSLGAIIKRHKRTLINFQESFIIPFVEKAAWRYMQFDPEHYPVNDYKFVATSSLGIIAREYEVTQLTQLLQTMGQDSPLYAPLVMAIVDNMSLGNSEELKKTLTAASQPSPEAQQAAQAQQESQLRFQASQSAALEAQANESAARAAKYVEETRMLPFELRIKATEAATKNMKSSGNEGDEFEKRIKLVQTLLDERKVALMEKKDERESKAQEGSGDKAMKYLESAAEMEMDLMRRLNNGQ